ncbi:hypothetical protein NKJ74_19855 [Mesorhizobium sp. M0046]|uniref:hypothetical protein n=1 Tax=Mesorhizobium sp. M0046 TaxID=2956858 RepID=UPI00333CDA90
MPATIQLKQENESAQTSRHSQRLNALRVEASRIRRRHLDGEISATEAAEELNKLKQKYAGFFERILDL